MYLFLAILQQTTIISLSNFKPFVFVMRMFCVVDEVGHEFLYVRYWRGMGAGAPSVSVP